MSGYNRIIMLGNLTRDPELRSLQSGQTLCRLGLACNRQFKSKGSDSTGSEVCFIDIEVWGAQAENCNKFLAKGRQVLVEGRLKYDSWQDQEGNRRNKHSIVADRVTFIRGSNQDNIQEDEQQASDTSAKTTQKQKASEGTFDEELPF